MSLYVALAELEMRGATQGYWALSHTLSLSTVYLFELAFIYFRRCAFFPLAAIPTIH